MSHRSIEEHTGDPEPCALCPSLATLLLDGCTPLCADHVELAMEYGPGRAAPANRATPRHPASEGHDLFAFGALVENTRRRAA